MDWSDPQGQRFTATSALLDTLNEYFPDGAEVGVATFRQYLYYVLEDEPRFAQCPDQDTGSYIPLLGLSTQYAQYAQINNSS